MAHEIPSIALAILVAVLSIAPVSNMLSPGQVMNTSFDPFELVNTYGAFGSVGRERYEIVLEGTDDDRVVVTSERDDMTALVIAYEQQLARHRNAPELL